MSSFWCATIHLMIQYSCLMTSEGTVGEHQKQAEHSQQIDNVITQVNDLYDFIMAHKGIEYPDDHYMEQIIQVAGKRLRQLCEEPGSIGYVAFSQLRARHEQTRKGQ